MGPFPLFQYLPALLLAKLGLADGGIYDGLTVISLISFCVVLAIIASPMEFQLRPVTQAVRLLAGL